MKLDVIILAAGLGSRLKGFTSDRPKAMVSVAGKPLIDHALSFLDFTKIQRIFVIGGYEGEVLKKHLDPYGSQVCFIENPDYRAGSVLTLEKALPFIEGNFLLMNVDHIYPRKMFDTLLNRVSPSAITAMADSDRKLVDDDMKIHFREGGVIGKISKQLLDFEAGYIGMSFIGKEKLEIYKKAVHAVKETTAGKANVEAVLDYLAPVEPIQVLDLSGMGWYEVDTPEDREIAEKAL